MLRLIHRPRPVPSFLRVTKGWNSSASLSAPSPGRCRRRRSRSAPSPASRVRQRQRAAVGHGVDGVDEQVDQHLLQLLAVDRRPPRRARSRARTRDARARQQVAAPAPGCRRAPARCRPARRSRHTRPAARTAAAGSRSAACARSARRPASVRPAPRSASAPSSLAQQVEVALDHRDRVVDLVRDAGGELADGGQLLARARAAAAPARSSRVRSATLASSSSFQRCSARVLSSMVSSRWSRWPASWPISSLLADRADARVERRPPRPLHRLRHAFERREDAARPAQRQTSAAGHQRQQRRHPMPSSTPSLSSVNGRSRKPTYSMPTRRPGAVGERLVARDVPVVDDEGAVEPGVAARRAPRRAPSATRGCRWRARRVAAPNRRTLVRDAHVVEEQRRGARLPNGSEPSRVDDLVDVVDEGAGCGSAARRPARGRAAGRRARAPARCASITIARSSLAALGRRGVARGHQRHRHARGAAPAQRAARSAQHLDAGCAPAPAPACAAGGARHRAGGPTSVASSGRRRAQVDEVQPLALLERAPAARASVARSSRCTARRCSACESATAACWRRPRLARGRSSRCATAEVGCGSW